MGEWEFVPEHGEFYFSRTGSMGRENDKENFSG
jgi:hypothetical protein